MDLYLEKEKELFKLNAKLNAKTKKMNVIVNKNVVPVKTQIITSNNNFNYYEEILPGSSHPTVTSEENSMELMCRKINISNQPMKKPQEIVYPLFQRSTAHKSRRNNLDIIIPITTTADHTGAEQPEEMDVKSNKSITYCNTEVESFKTESLITRFSEDSLALTPVKPFPSLPLTSPPICNDIVPMCLDKRTVSSDGLLKFLKSKVAILQTELDAGKNLNDMLDKENGKSLKKIKKLTTQQEKSCSKIDTMEITLKMLQEKHVVAEQGLKDKEVIISDLNKELCGAREELKEVNHNHQVMEKRVLRTQEDYDMIKSKYDSYRDIEVIMRESAKDERLEYEEKIRRLKKSRLDLMKAYKQQIILIDNLRKQNVCLEKVKALEITEKEFLKVLDWNFAEK